MAKGLYFGVGGKARKGKRAYIGIGGKARKIKKMYIGIGGKARLCYSSGLFGKAHARFSSYQIPVVLNNPDVTNPTGWTVSTRTGTTFAGINSNTAYAFGKWFAGYSATSNTKTALMYSTDGITYTKGAEFTVTRMNDGSTVVNSGMANISPLINCDGRLFGRSATIFSQGGSQSGGGGSTYFTYVEFNSSGTKIAQATGYTFDYSSINSGYGAGGSEGSFNRTYSGDVYHNGYIYHAYTWRYRDKNRNYKGTTIIALERYNISTGTFETVADNFFKYEETTVPVTNPVYSTGINVFLCKNTILVAYNYLIYRYDPSTGTITELINPTSTFCPQSYVQINENTFLCRYGKSVYSYNGSVMTLVTTHSNTLPNSGSMFGMQWVGDRCMGLHSKRLTTSSATTPITLWYTLDGITFTEDSGSLSFATSLLSNYTGSSSDLYISTCPAPS